MGLIGKFCGIIVPGADYCPTTKLVSLYIYSCSLRSIGYLLSLFISSLCSFGSLCLYSPVFTCSLCSFDYLCLYSPANCVPYVPLDSIHLFIMFLRFTVSLFSWSLLRSLCIYSPAHCVPWVLSVFIHLHTILLRRQYSNFTIAEEM